MKANAILILDVELLAISEEDPSVHDGPDLFSEVMAMSILCSQYLIGYKYCCCILLHSSNQIGAQVDKQYGNSDGKLELDELLLWWEEMYKKEPSIGNIGNIER